jgi:hypothetical protein
MVLLFAAIAMVIVWAVGVGIKKWRAGRAGSGAGQSSTGGHAVLAFLLLGALSLAFKTASTGSVIAAEGARPSQRSSETALSTVCKFTLGPRVGTTQDFSELSPVPIGSPCTDGEGSRGVVIARDPFQNLQPFPSIGRGAGRHGGSGSGEGSKNSPPGPGPGNSPKGGGPGGGGGLPVPTNPRAGGGLRRVTGTAIIVPGQKEDPGYALYSYALMSHLPQGAELPRVKAYLSALLALPTAAAVEQNLPRTRINITYLPLDALGWHNGSIETQVKYVVEHYDYARGAAMLASLDQRTGQGPVIISLLKPLDLSGHPHPVLVQDLTSAEPTLMASYVTYFVNQTATDQFQKDETLSNFGLRLRNGLEVAAEGVGMSKDAVATWVKFFE